MQLVPVLEIRHGKCVHTEFKNQFAEEVIKEDVIEVVSRLTEKGVQRLHIVDVDAIESGEPENVNLIRKVKLQFPDTELQVIGGIKCIESAYVWADAGVDYLILSGRASRQRDLLDDICMEFPHRVMAEIDCNQKKLASDGLDPIEQLLRNAQRLENDGVMGLIVTHIGNSGMRDKSSLAILGEFTESLEIPVYANGGINNTQDLEALLASHVKTPAGILVGKPLHNGEICLDSAHGLLQQYLSSRVA